MTLFHKNFNDKKLYVTITLNEDLQFHLYLQAQSMLNDLFCSQELLACGQWLKNYHFCQLFFCFLKMKKMDLRPFCFKAKIFSSQIYLNAIFLYFLRFFILTKNLNAAHTPTEMK